MRARLIVVMTRLVHRRVLLVAALPASAALAIVVLALAQGPVVAATPPAYPGPTSIPQCPPPPLLPQCQTIPNLPRQTPLPSRSGIGGLPIIRATPPPSAATNRGAINSGVAGLGAPNENTPSATLSDEQRQESFLAAEHAATQAALSPSIPVAVTAGTAAGAVVLLILVPAAIFWRRRRASS